MINLQDILKEEIDVREMKKFMSQFDKNDKDRIIKYFDAIDKIMAESAPYDKLIQHIPNEFVDEILRPYIQGEYGKVVHCYKGMCFAVPFDEFQNPEDDDVLSTFSKVGKSVEMKEGAKRKIMGWTTSRMVARQFARMAPRIHGTFGAVVEADIPVEQIIYMSSIFHDDAVLLIAKALDPHVDDPRYLDIYDMKSEDEVIVDHRAGSIQSKIEGIQIVYNEHYRLVDVKKSKGKWIDVQSVAQARDTYKNGGYYD